MSALEMANILPPRTLLTTAIIERWVAAVLAQSAALREHDRWLYAKDASQLPSANRLHAAWREWADGAQELLRRAEEFQSTGSQISGLDQLRGAIGRTLTILDFSPELALKRREQAERGEVYTIEEVRRELRLRARG
jgi:hypothetical protein